MKLYIKITNIEYMDSPTQQLYWEAHVDGTDHHSGNYQGFIQIGSLDTSSGYINTIAASCESQYEAQHSVSIGVLDQRYVFAHIFSGLFS